MEYELKHVELMQANVRANGIVFTVDDLMKITSAHKALGLDGKVPLKFGHNDEQPITDGKPALGWCNNLQVVDDRLVGDFVGLPKVVYDAFKTGRYKNVSVELLKNVQAGSRIIPWVIDAVALLGADQPAFGNLKDLQSLTMARGQPPKHESRATFSMTHAQTADEVRAEYEAKIRMAAVESEMRVAITGHNVAPAACEMFRRTFKGEQFTVENWINFARTQPKPRLGQQRGKVIGEDDSSVAGDGTAAEQLNRLCAAEVEAERVKFGRVVQAMDAARAVHKRHPELVRRWHEEQQF